MPPMIVSGCIEEKRKNLDHDFLTVLSRLGRKIGSGSFGDIYLGTNISTGEEGILYTLGIYGRSNDTIWLVCEVTLINEKWCLSRVIKISIEL